MVPPATDLAVAGRDLPRLTYSGRADRSVQSEGGFVASVVSTEADLKSGEMDLA